MAGGAPPLLDGDGEDGIHRKPAVRAAASGARDLLDAAGRGDLERAAAILEEGRVGINTARIRGCTALHEAAKGGHVSVVTDLLHRSAAVNAVNRSGCTPLHFAVLCKDKVRGLEVAEFLLDTSAVVNATAERMDTPLHFAAFSTALPGCEELVRCLLERRASVNMRNRKSETALMNACLHDNAGVVGALLERGADVGLQSHLGKTARDLAEEQGCQAALGALERQADPRSQLQDISQQMRAALSQVHSAELRRGELLARAQAAEAQESLAESLLRALDRGSRGQLAEAALQSLRGLERGWSGGAMAGAEQGRLLQALATLQLVARCRDGPPLLLGLGVVEVLPFMEQQLAFDRAGARELRELKLALGGAAHQAAGMGPFVEAPEVETPVEFHPSERSRSSTPSTCTENTAGGSSPPALTPGGKQLRCQSSLSSVSSATSRTRASLFTGHRALRHPGNSPTDRGEAESDGDAPGAPGELLAGGAASSLPQCGLRFKSSRAHRPSWRGARGSRSSRPFFADASQVVNEESGAIADSTPWAPARPEPEASTFSPILPRKTEEAWPAIPEQRGGDVDTAAVVDSVGERRARAKCCPRRGRSACVLH